MGQEGKVVMRMSTTFVSRWAMAALGVCLLAIILAGRGKAGNKQPEIGLEKIITAKDFKFTGVAFLPDGQRALTISIFLPKNIQSRLNYNGLLLWDLRTGKVLRQYLEGKSEKKELRILGYMCQTLSPDGKLVATMDWWGEIRIWEVETGKLFRHINPHEQGIQECAELIFSPNGKTFLGRGRGRNTGTGDFILWDTATGKVIQKLSTGAGHGRSVFSLDGKKIYYISGLKEKQFLLDERYFLQILDVDSNKVISTSEEVYSYPHTFSPNRKLLFSRTQIWDLEKGTLLRELNKDEDYSHTACFSTDSSLILTVYFSP